MLTSRSQYYIIKFYISDTNIHGGLEQFSQKFCTNYLQSTNVQATVNLILYRFVDKNILKTNQDWSHFTPAPHTPQSYSKKLFQKNFVKVSEFSKIDLGILHRFCEFYSVFLEFS